MPRDLLRAGTAGVLVVAALMAMHRVFTEAWWQPEAVAAGLLAVGIAAAARRVRLGVPGVLVAELIALAVFTSLVHLPEATLLSPWEQLERLTGLLRTGLQQFRDQPSPTVPLDGLRLLVTTGAWMVGATTHELLVRRTAPLLALLPPALLWVVPLAVPQPPGRTWPHTLPLLAAAALALLLESDAEVGDWVRERSAPRLTGAGVLLGIGALALAGLAPGLLPGYGDPPWLDRARVNPRGYQPIVDVGDRLHLPEDRDVLEVTADRRVYLRLAALDSFDGVTWRLGPPGSTSFSPDSSQLFPARGGLPPEVPIRSSEEVQVAVRVLDLENIYVPAPYQPVAVSGPGVDRMVYSRTGGFLATGELHENRLGGRLRPGVREGLRYSVTAEVPSPTYEELSSVGIDPEDPGLAPYLQLPGRYTALRDQARRVYAEAGASTAVERAFALQRWFTGADSPFTYSTDVPGLRGSDALQQFVLEDRVGYCEYFATAMAVMLRATGIPARVSVGFLPGTSSPSPTDTDGPETFTVSTADAHAWVEVLFPGYGWIRFEPTPRGDGATMTPRPEQLAPPLPDRQRTDTGAAEEPQPPEEPTSAEGGADQGAGIPTPQPEAVPQPDERQRGGGLPLWPLLALAGIVTVGGGLTAAVVVRRTRRGWDDTPTGRVLAAQERVLGRARRLGVGRRPPETAPEVTRRWAHEGRVHPEHAARFASACQAAAFGDGVDPGEAAEAEALADALVTDLRDSVSPGSRALAPVRVPAEAAAEATRELTDRLRALVPGGPGRPSR